MLRRGGTSGNVQWKPFVLPVKAKAVTNDAAGDDEEAEAMARRNRKALQSGSSMTIKRLPFLSFLNVPQNRAESAQKLRQPFRSPCANGRSSESERLLQVKTLGMRRRWSGSVNKPLIRHELPPVPIEVPLEPEAENREAEPVVESPATSNPASEPVPPLVLWQSEENPEIKVVVPEIVGKFLRPHQREGVQFMFDCVSGVRGFAGNGCILADDMGLGKTLQSITLVYTLLSTGMDNMQPTIKRAIVVCPTSLVKNWDDEIIKWLHGRVKTIALFEANRDAVVTGISQFIEGSKRPRLGSAQVLIISYETFRMHAQRFHDEPSCCELLICDEAHRLKNSNSQINKALSALACRRRVLLSGTPMQNDLEEFFAMVDFTNPNILGSPSEFRKQYLSHILVGREPDSTDHEREVAQSCSAMLCEIVNQFILRRGNILNAKHLPPKLMQVVCCNLSPLQEQLYTHFLSSSAFHDMMRRGNAKVLPSITALKKLCNHPSLIFDDNGKSNTKLPGFEGCASYFANSTSGAMEPSGRRGGMPSRSCHPEWSGKMLLLDKLMLSMKKSTTDRIVIVSNYTQTLDVVSALCRERNLPFVRLDGTTSAKKRKKLVDVFNDPTTNSFAFLLSSKAGGCGLNLIGANRLVLFDPDWNPATDKQAAARVWREGQKKMCFVYRFLATGTLEEKIFQRQLSKEGLQNIVDDKEEVNSLSSKDLKRLFVLRKDTLSDTHDQLKCERCDWRITSSQANDADADMADGSPNSPTTSDESTESKRHYHPQIGMPPEEDLNNWGHHRAYDSVDDPVMQEALKQAQNTVSFAFSCRVDWELLQEFHVENEDQKQEERKKQRLERIEAAKRRKAMLEAGAPSKRRKAAEVLDESDDWSSSASSSDDAPTAESDSSDSDDVEMVDVIPAPKANKVAKPASPVLDTSADSESEPRDSEKTDAVTSPPPPRPSFYTGVIVDEDMKESEPPNSSNWHCTRCTLANPIGKDICDGCGLRFRRSRLYAAPVIDDWDDE
ncbi:TPA: hypothetical protein N0F65_002031 [Lagenidium giganteum]|uniref:DNA repair and recombination protein RAD54 n=1 Tax=Lagenidium giganteum TaxID=4803 RepID=A0AAV2YY98_9STRA|nr:TPA: hypothetical protein N0F65_002031 [Lagenidium giganteum]